MRFCLGVFALFLVNFTFGQFDPVFSGNVGDHSWLNPATTGIENKYAAHAVYRIDWVNAGTPSKPHKYIFSGESNWVFNQQVEGKDAWKSTLGIGLNIAGDHYVMTGNQFIKIPLSKPIKIYSSTLSFGIAPGFLRKSFISEYSAPNDPFAPTETVKSAQTKFDLDLGAHWTNDQIYASFSMVHVTSPRFTEGNVTVPIHYYFAARAKLDIKNCKLIPSLMIRNNNVFSAVETQLFFQLRDEILTLGLGRRFGQAILFSIATKYEHFAFSYFYDLNRVQSTNAIYGAHEFRLSYQIAND